jgi:alkylation response protein AidB-like acyl-CoA dehydrogenase
MDLRYGEEYDRFREEVRAFVSAHWPLGGEEAELSAHEQVLRFRRRAIEAGYLARAIPKAYGGSEQPPDALKGQIIREEFGRAGAPGDARGIGTMMLVPTLLEKGEEWQKDKWVPGTVLGEITWCQGYSEPGSGSDLASLKTRGELVGDEWVINGQKIWTSGAHHANYMFCLVRTEPEAPKHAGISYLLIDMKQPGIDVRPLKMMTGSADFNEVFLNDVRTPADWIVGKRGEGWSVSRTTLKHERNSIGDATMTEITFKGLVRLARETQRGGRPAIEDPEIRQRLAAIEGYVLAHKYSGYRQLTAQLRGESPGLVGMMNKLASTNIGDMVAKLALDLLGDDGLRDPQGKGRRMGFAPRGTEGWLTQYMSSLGIAIAGGTANIQRNVIGERGLGLPRDLAAQRGR